MAKVENNEPAWPEISKEARRSHEILFYSQGPLDGYLIGERARDLFLHSGLRLTALSQIWNLADVSNDNLLNVDEFVLAVHLIQGVLQGRPIPKSLPENLMPKPSSIVSLPQISDGEKEAYSKIFQSYDSSRKGFISCIDARELLQASKLSVEQLAEVWDISDVNRDGSLDVDEWTVACQLVRLLKQGQSLEGSVNPFTYLPDRISPTSLHARKNRVDQYEKQKQRLMLLKEKRKNQAVRESRRLDLLKEKSSLEKDLYNKLKSLGKCSLSEEEFNKIVTQDAGDIERLEEIVIRLKKEHEKIRQETVKVILGEQKLQVEFQSIKRETDELAKRLGTQHTKATKDPDPFHQLYEQLKEERKKSNLSEGEEPEIHLPFKISPFDKEGLKEKFVTGADIFINPHVINNNNIKSSNENKEIIENLHEFDDKLIEVWSSPKARRSSSASSDIIMEDTTSEVEEKDEIFMTIKERDNWLSWKDDTLLGTNDCDLKELQRKLIDLKTEMQKLNSDAGGRLVFRNQSDYLARKKAKDEEEQQEKSKHARRSKSSIDPDLAAKRRSYVIDKRKEELDSAREKRLNRRSLNIDLLTNGEGEKSKSRAPDRPTRPPSVRNSDIVTSDSSLQSAPERPRRGRPSSQEIKSSEISPTKTSTPVASPRKSASPTTSPTRSTKKVRAPEPPTLPDSKQTPSSVKESKIPVPNDIKTDFKENKVIPERPPRRKKKSSSDSEPSSPRPISITETKESQITSPAENSSVDKSELEKLSDIVTTKSELVTSKSDDIVKPETVFVESKSDVKVEIKSVDSKQDKEIIEEEIPPVQLLVSDKTDQKSQIIVGNTEVKAEIVDEVVVPVKRNLDKTLPPVEKLNQISTKFEENSLNKANKEDSSIKYDINVEKSVTDNHVVNSLVETDEIELEDPVVVKPVDIKDTKKPFDDNNILTNGDIDFDIKQNSESTVFINDKTIETNENNFEADSDSLMKDGAGDVGLLESIVQTLDFPSNKNHILADKISLTPSVGSDTQSDVDSLPPLPDSAPPTLPADAPPQIDSEQIVEEEVVAVISSKPVHSELISREVSYKPKPVIENNNTTVLEFCSEYSGGAKKSTSNMSVETEVQEQMPNVNGAIDVYMNDFQLEAKLKQESIEQEEEDSDLSDNEDQNGQFEAMFTPGEHQTGSLPTAAMDDEDSGGIQLISFNTTSMSIQSPGESQTDSAFEDMASSMHSNDADNSNQVSLSNTLEDFQDSLVTESFESIKSSFEESQPPTISPPETPRMSYSIPPKKFPVENRPMSPPDPSKSTRDTTSIVKKAQLFSESLNRPPKVTIRASSEEMSEQRLQELDAERRAVINMSKNRKVFLEESDEEIPASSDKVEVNNTTIWDTEESDSSVRVSFGTKINLEDKPDKVDLYGQNIVKEGDTTESVDRESIADLASTRKQWENLFHTSKETTPGLTPQKSSSVKHWEVKLPYKPVSAPVEKQTELRSPSPVLQSELRSPSPLQNNMEEGSSNHVESAIEREIRLANEREQMLRREQEERTELMKRQNASKQQVNLTNFENNNNTEFKTMYHEMTEADRGSEMKIRETMIQQELNEQKVREEALSQKSGNVEETEEGDIPVESTESLIAKEIMIQRQREEEISKRYKKEPVQTSQNGVTEEKDGSDISTTKELNYEDAIASNQHEGESLIARELRETREREEELRRQRERLSNKTVSKEPETPSKPVEEPPTAVVQSPPIQTVQSSKTYTSPRSSSQVARSIKVAPIADSPSDDEEENSVPTKKPETPIEREIRLARERENELRRMKGLPVIEVQEEPEREQVPVKTPTSSKSESYVYTRKSGSQSNTMRSFASSRLQNELMKQKERENAYRQEGRIITTSEDHIEPLKYSEVAGVNASDGPVKRNFVTRKSISSLSDGERTPSENGDMEPYKPVTTPTTPQSSSKEPRFARRSGQSSGGAAFSYKESSQKAESKIEKELREMREREEELRQSRVGSGVTSPSSDSPRDTTQNSHLSLAAQWEQKYSK